MPTQSAWNWIWADAESTNIPPVHENNMDSRVVGWLEMLADPNETAVIIWAVVAVPVKAADVVDCVAVVVVVVVVVGVGVVGVVFGVGEVMWVGKAVVAVTEVEVSEVLGVVVVVVISVVFDFGEVLLFEYVVVLKEATVWDKLDAVLVVVVVVVEADVVLVVAFVINNPDGVVVSRKSDVTIDAGLLIDVVGFGLMSALVQIVPLSGMGVVTDGIELLVGIVEAPESLGIGEDDISGMDTKLFEEVDVAPTTFELIVVWVIGISQAFPVCRESHRQYAVVGPLTQLPSKQGAGSNPWM
jgi:hypothetical protein